MFGKLMGALAGRGGRSNTGVAGGKPHLPQQASGMLGKSAGPMGKLAAGAAGAAGKRRSPMSGRGFTSKRY